MFPYYKLTALKLTENASQRVFIFQLNAIVILNFLLRSKSCHNHTTLKIIRFPAMCPLPCSEKGMLRCQLKICQYNGAFLFCAGKLIAC